MAEIFKPQSDQEIKGKGTLKPPAGTPATSHVVGQPTDKNAK